MQEFSLESDKITALWPKDSFTFPFYVILSKSIPNWTTFVREIVWFDAELRKWQNDWCDQMTAKLLISIPYSQITY